MVAYQKDGYKFIFRSGGVVVLKGDEYIGFYDTLVEAHDAIFGA